MKYKFTIVGLGYVGLSLATLLSTKHHVTAYDKDKNKVDLLTRNISPIRDELISRYLNEKDLNLQPTSSIEEAYSDQNFVIICVPTDYNPESQYFNTSLIDKVLRDIAKSSLVNPTIIIKSTIPIGYIDSINEEFKNLNIFFSPEFLREGSALYDNLYPSRIVIGSKSKQAIKFGKILKDCSANNDAEIIYTNPAEAESIKLFANTYLAMRVSFFNELDIFCEYKNLNTKEIIEGISTDPRIGGNYNNPSFGYGGYCLPKDTKQLLANYEGIPNSLISSIVKSNDVRKDHVLERILKLKPKTVGVYGISMKSGSDNFRESAVLSIIAELKKNNINLQIYDNSIDVEEIIGIKVMKDFALFADTSNLILANRYNEILDKYKNKTYTRDIFGDN